MDSREQSAAPVVRMRRPGDDPLETIDLRDWSGACSAADRARAIAALEGGRIVFLPHLGFELALGERRFLDPHASDGKHKNISFDPASGAVGGANLAGDEDRHEAAALLRRFGGSARALLAGLFPDYAAHLEVGRTSLRPVGIDGRRMSHRKDDRLLHVDAFPSQPVAGRRILRVFANVNPDGAARLWHVGGPFKEYARRLLPRWSRPVPGAAAALGLFGITKRRRTDYDWLMLALHDRGKADVAYQRDGVLAEILFPAGSSWIVFTDLVPHAALRGQHALEQTFYLPVAAMHDAERAPLCILEQFVERRLAG